MVTTKINTSQAAKGALAHRLQCRTACKIQNGRQGAPSMRKGRDGGKKKREKKEEKTDENSGHYVIASSRPLERRTLAPINLYLI